MVTKRRRCGDEEEGSTLVFRSEADAGTDKLPAAISFSKYRPLTDGQVLRLSAAVGASVIPLWGGGGGVRVTWRASFSRPVNIYIFCFP